MKQHRVPIDMRMRSTNDFIRLSQNGTRNTQNKFLLRLLAHYIRSPTLSAELATTLISTVLPSTPRA